MPMIVSHGSSAITPNLLILGGTLEATALCTRLAQLGAHATVSLAGRVARPKPQPVPMRIGGFGGVEGLQAYLRTTQTTHVIDATHPFASQMSTNARTACAGLGLPLVALTRPPWSPTVNDTWQSVPDITGAVAALDRPASCVMLAIGRMHLAPFAAMPQHRYILRLVDPPEPGLPLPDTTVIVDRGPFTRDNDLALFRAHDVQLVVSKNAGGIGAQAKILAARALGIPVIMIDRPVIPNRHEVHDVDAVLRWLTDHDAYLGV